MVQDQNFAMATAQLNSVGAEGASEPWLFDEGLVATEVERGVAAGDTSSKMAGRRPSLWQRYVAHFVFCGSRSSFR